jgi:hypothetical protein
MSPVELMIEMHPGFAESATGIVPGLCRAIPCIS